MSRQDWFWQQYLEDDRVLYMVYNVCWDKETEKTFFPTVPGCRIYPISPSLRRGLRHA